MRALVALSLAFGSASQAASTTAFDLSCEIKSEGMAEFKDWGKIPFFPMRAPARAAFVEFRVDLSERRYCDGTCAETKLISRMGPTVLILESTGEDAKGAETLVVINRESGDYSHQTWWNGITTTMKTGVCSAKPFTGFPRLKF